MTRVAVLGDSQVGKTKFMHLATSNRMPLNVFSSRSVERFYLNGTNSTAEFVVVPGNASQTQTLEAVKGADALLILCSESLFSVRKWLAYGIQNKQTTTPIIVCAHNVKIRTDQNKIANLLRYFPTAEYTETNVSYVTGIVDCANRIVMRARKELGSPL